jgi:hypothetical protein
MKKITFKTLSILIAAVILLAALPVTAFADDVSPCSILPCEHNYQMRESIRYVPLNEDYHHKIIDTINYCTWCGDSSVVSTVYILEDHSFVSTHNERYVYATNDHHYYIEEDVDTCLVCKGIYVEQQEPSRQLHEFDDSVDPEVDMDGICIYCHEWISW